MNLCIIGCGDLGSRVARLAVDVGHRLWGARRSAAPLPPGVESLRLDVSDPATIALPGELDALVYAVAATERTDQGYRQAYPLGLGHVLHALHDPARVRVLFISSTAVYGESGGAWVDETTPARPSAFSGKRLLEAEQLLGAAGLRSAAALRLGGIYGPGRGRLMGQACDKSLRLPDADEWTNRIHVDDGARAILHLLELERSEPIYNVVDEAPSRRADVLAFIAARLGAKAPMVDPSTPLGPRGRGKRISSALLSGTGFSWRYPSYREGYGELIASAGS